MEIRKCTDSDIIPTGAFYDKVVAWLDEHINYPKWVYQVYPSENSVREMTKTNSQYICMDDGKIIGAFVLNDDPQGNYRKGNWSRNIPEGNYMVIHALAIDPQLQGKGLGTDVIRFCVNKAKQCGYQALRLDIVPDNIPARKLYEKNGFLYAGDADLERGIENIPVFSLFELNWRLP